MYICACGNPLAQTACGMIGHITSATTLTARTPAQCQQRTTASSNTSTSVTTTCTNTDSTHEPTHTPASQQCNQRRQQHNSQHQQQCTRPSAPSPSANVHKHQHTPVTSPPQPPAATRVSARTLASEPPQQQSAVPQRTVDTTSISVSKARRSTTSWPCGYPLTLTYCQHKHCQRSHHSQQQRKHQHTACPQRCTCLR